MEDALDVREGPVVLGLVRLRGVSVRVPHLLGLGPSSRRELDVVPTSRPKAVGVRQRGEG